jgi:hypothetical protein
MANGDKVNIESQEIDQAELDVAFRAVREHADRSLYGKMISDKECREVATEVVIAVEDYKSGRAI